MTVYTVVNATVIRRRRDPEDLVEIAEQKRRRRRHRSRPELDDQVKGEFRSLNQLGRRSGSTR